MARSHSQKDKNTQKKMNSEQIFLDKWRSLTTIQQQEVLDFIDFIEQKSFREKLLSSPSSQQRTERVKKWLNWASSHPQDSPGLPDEALRRDSIYDTDELNSVG